MAISVCMIVKNEAGLLPRVLASVAAVASEVIVCDTGSTDSTVKVARRWGARVVTYPWHDDFAAARNASIAPAQGDWILVIDADEVLRPGTAEFLQAVDGGQPVGNVPVAQLLLVNLLRREVGAQQAPYTLVSRFFRNHPQLRFSRAYHETVDDSVVALQQSDASWQVASWSQVALDHDGYSGDALQGKLQRARRVMEAYLRQHPEDVYTLNKLGALYVQQGQPQGLTLLQRGLDLGAEEPIVAHELHYHMALAYRQQQQLGSSAYHYQQALAQPLPGMLKLAALINYGSLLKAQGQLQEARQAFGEAVAIDPDNATAHYNLGTTHRACGDLSAAIAAYRRALQLQPDYAEAHQNLGVALIKLGNLPEGQAAFQRAIALYQGTQPVLASRLRHQLLQLGLA